MNSDADGSPVSSLPDRQEVMLPTGRVSYRQAGSGPDMVFLHGLAGNSGTWIRQFEYFATRFKITAWDAPGYGNSDTVTPDIDVYADLLGAFTASLGIERFILLGHSMGGVVAGNFSGRYPDRVARLILSCTHLGRNQRPGTPLGAKYLARLAQYEEMTPLGYGRARAESMTAPGCHPKILEDFAHIAAETRKEGLEAAMRTISEADNRTPFASLDMPVLVLAGDLDKTVPKALTEGLIAAIPEGVPSSSVHYLPGVAHAPYMEDVERYNKLLSDFLLWL
jgi:pimeloyl-ACP methyl ester carboxylesterase